jgi:pSer/pThr/pTyr-binding forkhead associated (FHA) protein
VIENESNNIVLLVHRIGEPSPRREVFAQDVIKVGRLPSSHLRFEEDSDVSRMHAVIERTLDGAVHVIDLGAPAGTVINGRKINKRKLERGDRITFGRSMVEVERLPVDVNEEPATPTPVAAAPRSSVEILDAAMREARTRVESQVHVIEAVGFVLGEWAVSKDTKKAAKSLREKLPKSILDELEASMMRDIIGDDEGPSEPLDPLPEIVEPFDENDIELVVTAQAFEPNYSGWNVQFQAVRAPRLAHQTSDPTLEAFVKLDVVDASMQLEPGGSTALALDDEQSRHALRPLTGTAEGNMLASFFGAASVDTGGTREIPTAMPSEEKVFAAMKKSLDVHLEKVCEERARLKVTETGAGFVGRRFTVKGEKA